MTLKKTAAMLTAAAAMLSAADTGAFVGRVTADDGIQAVFYVSPDGDDSADGSEGAPFATLERARDAVRAINGSMTGDIVVRLRGGDYRITKPVDFDTRDSGTGGFTVRYEACEGESPVINGAVKVTGWTKYNDKLWVAPLDRDIKLRNLYVNDRRANMGSVTVQAKGGYGDYNITAGQADWAWDSGKKSDGIVYGAGDMPRELFHVRNDDRLLLLPSRPTDALSLLDMHTGDTPLERSQLQFSLIDAVESHPKEAFREGFLQGSAHICHHAYCLVLPTDQARYLLAQQFIFFFLFHQFT